MNGICPLEERIQGLGILGANAEGRSVLDLGCAEGLVSQWLVDHGATGALGFDYNKTRVRKGNQMTGPNIVLSIADLATIKPLGRSFDIVLLLAILQKMREPKRLLDYAIQHSHEWLAVRTPSPIICDKRSDFRRINIKEHVCSAGFEWIFVVTKPIYVGVFRRTE